MPEAPTIDGANTTWLLVSTALVLLMTPGLALFYGGLNRAKGVLNMMMMSFSAIGLISVLWWFYGFSVAFGTDVNGFWGDPGAYLGTKTFLAETDLWGATTENPSGIGIPLYVFMAFQMVFAVITVALISGAIADRAKFAGWLLFAFGWATLVYFPVAHWVWGGGIIGGDIHALDFAGGTAVHINAGAAALAVALVLGKRLGWPREGMKPHNIPLVALGAGLLWFGWFGFNAGSELTVDSVAALAFINTQLATAAAVLGWIAVEWVKDRKPTMVGASSGAVAGLVAITPACGFIAPWASVLLGVVAGVVCARGQPQVPARLRRLPRRGRRALRRWLDRLALARPVRHQLGQRRDQRRGGRLRRPLLRRRRDPARSAGPRRPDRHRLVVRHRLGARLRHREDNRLPRPG